MRFLNNLLPKSPYLKFIILAVVLMVGVDHFVFNGDRPYYDKIRKDYYADQAAQEAEAQRYMESMLPPKVVYPEDGSEYFEAPYEAEIAEEADIVIENEEITDGEPTEDAENLLMEMEGYQGPAVEKTLLVDNLPSDTSFRIPQPEQLSSTEQEKLYEDAYKAEPEAKQQEEPEQVAVDMITPERKPPVPAYAPRGDDFMVVNIPDEETYTKPAKARARIALVIDDMGVNVKQSRKALDLPPQVTLAFLPYADQVKDMSAKANAKGHETIVHVPMEAMDSKVNLGPMALRAGMEKEEFTSEFNRIMSAFDGYSGINNHMGSKFTQDRQSMSVFMAELKKRGLYFLDSKTIHTSVASDIAGLYEVPHTHRDVFIDHKEDRTFVRRSLKDLEEIALRNGQAVAIGHPKAVTIAELKRWIPTLEKKGIELVPLSAVTAKRSNVAVKPSMTQKAAVKETEPVVIAPQDVEPAAAPIISNVSQIKSSSYRPQQAILINSDTATNTNKELDQIIVNAEPVIAPEPVIITDTGVESSSFSSERIRSHLRQLE